MKETSQRYLNSEAHGYLMEAKAYKLLLKDLERIRTKLRRHIEKEAADREAEFEAAMQYHSESDIQEAYGWEFISEQQYEHYLELFRQGRRALDEHSPTVTELYSSGIFSSSGAMKWNVGLKWRIAISSEWTVRPYFKSPTRKMFRFSSVP